MGRNKANNKGIKSKKSSKNLVIYTLVFIALVGMLFVITKMEQSNKNTVFQDPPPITNQPTLGEETAPVTVVEFGDYKCPSCKAWGETLFPQLKKDYIDTGKVKFAYVNVLFHGEESTLAASAAESVFDQDPEAFWTYHKALFDAQPKENHDAVWVTPRTVLDLAEASSPKIDISRMVEDIQNQKTVPDIKLDHELVEKYKVTQTPSIMVDGIMLADPFDYDQMKAIIDKQLGAK